MQTIPDLVDSLIPPARRALVLAVALSSWLIPGALGVSAGVHPLDPLSEAEIAAGVKVLRDEMKLRESDYLPLLVLNEPPKAEVLAYTPGAPVKREAFAVVYDVAASKLSEAIIDLGALKITQWKPLPYNAQPIVVAQEYDKIPELVRENPKWQDAMRLRQIEDFSKVHLDVWSVGDVPVEGGENLRLMRVLAFLRDGADHPYDRPIEGVLAVVDATHMKVMHVIDEGVIPIPDRAPALHKPFEDKAQLKLKPLTTSSPDGASFVVTGNHVKWHNWDFRFALHSREGLIIYQAGYHDGKERRSILYRGSLSEMVVPYGDISPSFAWRSAFDEGEYGIGWLADKLVPGEHVPSTAQVFDATYAAHDATPSVLPSAVAIYERDSGLLWKHTDYYTQKSIVKRGRELAIESSAYVGNYDYSFRWIFDEVGVIRVEVELNGMDLGKGVKAQKCSSCTQTEGTIVPTGDQKFGNLISDQLVAVNHQHIFNYRLDLDIDGTVNSVAEVNVRTEPRSEKNLYENGFFYEETVLANEGEAQRDMNLQTDRRWKIFNPERKNSLGHFRSYLLAPGENTVPHSGPGGSIFKRAGFVKHHFWVTQYDPREIYAAGDYPYLCPIADGLPVWVKDAESISKQDLVVWYTMGFTHLPSPEDWPLMPALRGGFKLIPKGFFNGNPILQQP